MTDMYDEQRSFDGRLKAYPHEDRGCEVRSFVLGTWLLPRMASLQQSVIIHSVLFHSLITVCN